jgi:hypothetical protein
MSLTLEDIERASKQVREWEHEHGYDVLTISDKDRRNLIAFTKWLRETGYTITSADFGDLLK